MPSPKMITIPALRLKMGDRMYYAAALTLQEIAERVRSISNDKGLSNQLHREVNPGRAQGISRYLLDNQDRFLGSLVIGVTGSSPDWFELMVKPNPTSEDESDDIPDGILGFLKFDGSEDLFTIDGQQRVAGIQKALRKNPALSNDEICVLFVAHRDTPEGIERTRRLVTNLNRKD
jgi:DNA sulfur modification protein DndB